MLRVLALSTLFPDASRPTFGIFVQRQWQALALLDDVEVAVIAPVGVPPGLSRHPRYRALAGLPAHERWAGLDVHRPRFATMPGMPRLTPARLARAVLPLARRLHGERRFDVLHADFFWPDGPAAVRIGRGLGLPLSIKARGADIHHWGRRRGTGAQVAAAGRAAAGMLAVSAALRDDMAALGLPAERIRVHHTGVDQARFRLVDRTAAKAALGVEGPLLVAAGHLVARKGFDLAIAAAARVPGATLLIAGEGPERARLEALVARLGLEARVRLLGVQAHEAMPGLLAAADVMVLPSASEGLANLWVEALACGTPLVIPPIGGAAEVVTTPAAGRLAPRDPAAIAAAVEALLANPPDRAATRACAAQFSWERNGRTLAAHLLAVRGMHG